MAKNFTEPSAVMRSIEIHTAKMCRVCLQRHHLVAIARNPRLAWCFSRILPSDPDLPQFVCATCERMVDILYQFDVLGNLTANLVRTYVTDGGRFPQTGMIEEELQRAEERLQRTASSKKSKSPDEDRKLVERPILTPVRKSEKYMRSVELLFGDSPDVKQKISKVE
ncbi:AAEL013738-PA [Aedes aegypti]|uniref:AAEL013738-PA n=1 Tax=Aedes aegypti TaxID=7159 RepID=Q16IB1_AEDAE|nr:AAEL013738-PA [Aedes aegypti]